MDVDALVMGHVDRRRRGAPVDRGQPAGIAVGEDLDPSPGLAVGDLMNQGDAVLADLLVDVDILIADALGVRPGRLAARGGR